MRAKEKIVSCPVSGRKWDEIGCRAYLHAGDRFLAAKIK